MVIKAIVFDFGGVIVNNTGDLTRRNFAEAYGVSIEVVNKAIGELVEDYQIGKINDDEFEEKFAKKVGKQIPKNAVDLWTKNYWDRGHITENVELVKELRAKGFKVVCLSNTIPPHVRCKRHEDVEIFDVVVLSCEVGMRKPDKEIYDYTLEKLGVGKEECVFIDDSEGFVNAAKKNGYKIILYESPEQLRTELNKLLNSKE